MELLPDYISIPADNIISATAKQMTENGINVVIVQNRQEALAKVIEMLESGASVMTGSSTTLKEIGFTDALAAGKLPVHDLYADIRNETDSLKRADLRRRSVTADIFLASVNAVTEDGQLVAVDASGSRTGAILFAAKKNILVVSANKIVKDLDAAFKRIRGYVFDLEDQRAMNTYKTHTSLNKWAILAKDVPGRTNVILVKEQLGF
jgi:L-lactate utilization protein LutB